MNTTTNPLHELQLDVETQLTKLSAWLQTFSFVLEGLENDGMAADTGNDINASLSLARRYPAYSEMLFLILGGLQDCKDSLSSLTDRETTLLRSLNKP